MSDGLFDLEKAKYWQLYDWLDNSLRALEVLQVDSLSPLADIIAAGVVTELRSDNETALGGFGTVYEDLFGSVGESSGDGPWCHGKTHAEVVRGRLALYTEALLKELHRRYEV